MSNKIFFNVLREGGEIISALEDLRPQGIITFAQHRELATWCMENGIEVWLRRDDDRLAAYWDFRETPCTGWIAQNEPQGNSRKEIRLQAIRERGFAWAAQQHGKRAGVCSRGTGDPGGKPNSIEERERVLEMDPALDIGDVAMYHMYQEPGYYPRDPESYAYHVGRIFRYVRYFQEAGLRHPPILVGEIGGDRISQIDGEWWGWRKGDVDRFLRDIEQVYRDLCLVQWVHGVAFFCLGHNGDPRWEQQDVLEEPRAYALFKRLCQADYPVKVIDASPLYTWPYPGEEKQMVDRVQNATLIVQETDTIKRILGEFLAGVLEPQIKEIQRLANQIIADASPN